MTYEWPRNLGSYYLREYGAYPFVESGFIENQGAFILGDY